MKPLQFSGKTFCKSPEHVSALMLMPQTPTQKEENDKET